MSIFFYHIFLWLYRAGIWMIAPWNPKAKLWLEGRKDYFDRLGTELERIGLYPGGKVKPGAGAGAGKDIPGKGASGKVVWMHCSSLGEFEQGRPILEAIRRERPGARIVLSFFSPSGYTVRKDYSGADLVCYLPLDGRGNARRFIEMIDPGLVLWVKYDYWYYYLVELHKRQIPVLLVSGVFRPDQPFFKWYGKLHRYMLECFTRLFVQTESSRQLLQGLGLTGNVVVSGDTRFDRVVGILEQPTTLPAIAAFCGEAAVIVAGSTWREDEEELDHYANTHPELRFVIAPHQIDEERLREVEKLFRRSIRWSAWEKQWKLTDNQIVKEPAQVSGLNNRPNVLIIDNIGMLSRLYKYAKIAYVGGGFGDDGVHNVLEPAVYGRPVVFGPVIEKYIEAVELVDCGGGIVIDSALEAESVFNRLLQDPGEYGQAAAAAREYVMGKRGATQRIMQYIQENRLLTS